VTGGIRQSEERALAIVNPVAGNGAGARIEEELVRQVAIEIEHVDDRSGAGVDDVTLGHV